MIISNLKGGLGNQMFEYAAGYSLAKEKGVEFKIDLDHFKRQSEFKEETPREFQLDFFNIPSKLATEEEIIETKKKYSKGFLPILWLDSRLIMLNLIRNPFLTKISSDVYLEGYFQSEEYFVKYEDDIREIFTLKATQITKDFQKVSDKIEGDFDQSISIHIRRGDYVTNVNANKHHGLLGKDYYYNALNYIKEKTGIIKPSIYIFSDDLDWVKENLSFDGNITYVSNNFNPAQTIILMSKCKNNIIANSSFSWWGAWLNEDKEKIVVAPQKWLAGSSIYSRDIIPKSWIKLA